MRFYRHSSPSLPDEKPFASNMGGTLLLTACGLIACIATQAMAQDEVDEARALAVQTACSDAAQTPQAVAIASALGTYAQCAISYDFYDNDAEAPYPFAETATLDWEAASFSVTTNYPEQGLYQGSWTIEADPDSGLDADWFAAARGVILPRIADWGPLDAATEPNEDGVIEFEFPGTEYRGPIIDRYENGGIRLIDSVSGNF